MKNLLKLLGIFAFAIVATACGGGGGGGGTAGTSPSPPPIPTYSISGTTIANAVISVSGPTTAIAVADAGGNYSLLLANGLYTFAPTLAGYVFSPVSREVGVNGANVSGVNFSATIAPPPPVPLTGKLVYPVKLLTVFDYVYLMDLATTVTTNVGLIDVNRTLEFTFVTNRTNNLLVYNGSYPIPGGEYVIGIAKIPLVVNALPVQVVYGHIDWTPGCSSVPQGSFDLTQNADVVVFSSVCSAVPNGNDIVLMLMDGSMFWVRVTSGPDLDTSPAMCSAGDKNSVLTVCFVRNGTEIRKQVVDPTNDSLIGPSTVLVSNIMDGKRAMSVNPTYTHLAFMKNVGGVPHITVMPLSGGVEVDLVPGSNPYWALDGSNRIMYTANGSRWAINQDGTGNMQLPTPGNLTGSVDQLVFGPAGF
mgnify:FL=1